MQATLRLPHRARYADYLAAEQNSECRHEFIDGVIVAMAGGSDEHNRITGRLAQLLGSRETGNCGYYPSDQRFWIASRGRGLYSDSGAVLALRNGFATYDFDRRALTHGPSIGLDHPKVRLNDGKADPHGNFLAGSMHGDRAAD